MKLVRWLLSFIVLFINFITWPRAGKRSIELQEKVDAETQHYSLYQFKACPFCVKVRRAARRLNLFIEVRDAKFNSAHRLALQQEGGKIKVPCLRIDNCDGQTQWMYESNDIIRYLNSKFPVEK